jgi:phosphate starvation-inducible PhoH-like protein
MFLTRVADGSTVVVAGDPDQSDIKGQNGLKTVIRMVEQQDLNVPVIDFGENLVVRSETCAMWVRAFRWDRKNKA